MEQVVRKSKSLRGRVRVPGDKSIAHRAAIRAAAAVGQSVIRDYPEGADNQSTLSCLRQLGVTITERNGDILVDGVGLRGFQAPGRPLDCGNSGTTMRLLTGLLCGQSFESVLVGDPSLSKRPMERVAGPLRLMGAQVELIRGCAPIRISPVTELRGIHYRLPVASAQVKSAIALAGLQAASPTTIVEPVRSRDHTERMFPVAISDTEPRTLRVDPVETLEPLAITIPGDFSSAAFLLVAGLLLADSEIDIAGVGINPSRTGLWDVLLEAGADLSLRNRIDSAGEPVADVTARTSSLLALAVGGAMVPRLIDEIPILAVAALHARGRSDFRDVAELRAKETDRLRAIDSQLGKMGADIESGPDWFAVNGPQQLHGAHVRSFGDHRMAMSLAIAGLTASGETRIQDAEAAIVSYPDFFDVLNRLAD